MEFEEIIYTKEEGIAIITLNRPERLNAITPRMIEEWLVAFEDAKQDDEVKVVVITGAGRGFCSGADVKAIAAGDEKATLVRAEQAPAEKRSKGRFGIQRIPRAVEGMEKPLIASVNGPAAGGGMDMASMCDLRIASDRAKFTINHVRIGLLSLDGGYYFLERIIGIPKTLELVWSYRTFDAQEALEMGYVNKVVPHEELAAATKELALRLAKGPAVAMQLAKRLVYRGWDSTLDEHLEDVETATVIAESTEDAREGPLAWAEKREPVFKGR